MTLSSSLLLGMLHHF